MAEVTYEVPEKGEARSATDGKVKTALTRLKETVNGKIGANNLEAEAVTVAKLSSDLQGGVGGTVFVAETARASETMGSFATPVKVTLPKVLAGQMVEVYAFGWPAPSTVVQLLIGPFSSIERTGEESAGKRKIAFTNENGLAMPTTLTTPEDWRDKLLKGESMTGGVNAITVARFLNKEDRSNFVVEIQGKGAPGTANIKDAYLMAHAVG